MNQFNLPFSNNWVLALLLLWVLFWKGVALWMAAQKGQKVWFLIILILNTFGILEIVYIFFILKKRWADIKEIFAKK